MVATALIETLSRHRISARLCTRFYGHGVYTSGHGFIRQVSAAPSHSHAADVGIDLGATHVRFAVGATTDPFLEVIYLTGRPSRFGEQVQEVGWIARALGARDLRSLAIATAGPVERHRSDYYVSLPNTPGWEDVAISALIRATQTWSDIRTVENDMLMLHPYPASNPGVKLLTGANGRPAIKRSRRDSESLRSLTVHVGTGLNIGLTVGGVSVALEYGHEPYPAILPRDERIVPVLANLHRRIVTWEDLLGGRALGPLFLAYCSGSRALSRAPLPPQMKATLEGTEGPARGDPFLDESEVMFLIRDLIRYTTIAAAAYGPPEPDTTWERLVRYGGWRIAEMPHRDGSPIGGFLSDWARRFGLFVLTACQTTIADEVVIACPRLDADVFRQEIVDALSEAAQSSRLGRGTLQRLTAYAWSHPNGALTMLRKARSIVNV